MRGRRDEKSEEDGNSNHEAHEDHEVKRGEDASSHFLRISFLLRGLRALRGKISFSSGFGFLNDD